MSSATLNFQLDRDDIAFSEFHLVLPYDEQRQRPPIASMPEGSPLTADVITEHYYPRIQAFLRDMKAGANAGAQYFIRLRAMVVRLPDTDRGYVVGIEHVLQRVNQRLAEFCAAEAFTASLLVASGSPGEGRAPAGADAYTLEGFPFFQVVFSDTDTSALTGIRTNAFAYSTTLLILVTILASVLVHRAVSQEVKLSQSKADFVSAVSHEFRSPLSSILALSERLEGDRVRDPAQLAQYHRIIGQEARRLSALVTRLLDFGQMEAGKKTYSFERVELVELAREAIRACHQSAPKRRIELRGEVAAPLWVRADQTALQHCVQNLIENAVKYSPADSVVTVSCISLNGSNAIDVRDAGIGIRRAEQARIFEKFYRGRGASDLDAQGVGIGLALVKHVMESHGGDVSVESEPGQGSRFRLLLPAVEI
jgi:signal transduction histidine kinase